MNDYVVIPGMSVSGIGMIQLRGAGPAIIEGEALSDFWDYPPRVPQHRGTAPDSSVDPMTL